MRVYLEFPLSPLAVHPSASGYTAVMFEIGWYDLCLIVVLCESKPT